MAQGTIPDQAMAAKQTFENRTKFKMEHLGLPLNNSMNSDSSFASHSIITIEGMDKHLSSHTCAMDSFEARLKKKIEQNSSNIHVCTVNKGSRSRRRRGSKKSTTSTSSTVQSSDRESSARRDSTLPPPSKDEDVIVGQIRKVQDVDMSFGRRSSSDSERPQGARRHQEHPNNNMKLNDEKENDYEASGKTDRETTDSRGERRRPARQRQVLSSSLKTDLRSSGVDPEVFISNTLADTSFEYEDFQPSEYKPVDKELTTQRRPNRRNSNDRIDSNKSLSDDLRASGVDPTKFLAETLMDTGISPKNPIVSEPNPARNEKLCEFCRGVTRNNCPKRVDSNASLAKDLEASGVDPKAFFSESIGCSTVTSKTTKYSSIIQGSNENSNKTHLVQNCQYSSKGISIPRDKKLGSRSTTVDQKTMSRLDEMACELIGELRRLGLNPEKFFSLHLTQELDVSLDLDRVMDKSIQRFDSNRNNNNGGLSHIDLTDSCGSEASWMKDVRAAGFDPGSLRKQPSQRSVRVWESSRTLGSVEEEPEYEQVEGSNRRSDSSSSPENEDRGHQMSAYSNNLAMRVRSLEETGDSKKQNVSNKVATMRGKLDRQMSIRSKYLANRVGSFRRLKPSRVIVRKSSA